MMSSRPSAVDVGHRDRKRGGRADLEFADREVAGPVVLRQGDRVHVPGGDRQQVDVAVVVEVDRHGFIGILEAGGDRLCRGERPVAIALVPDDLAGIRPVDLLPTVLGDDEIHDRRRRRYRRRSPRAPALRWRCRDLRSRCSRRRRSRTRRACCSTSAAPPHRGRRHRRRRPRSPSRLVPPAGMPTVGVTNVTPSASITIDSVSVSAVMSVTATVWSANCNVSMFASVSVPSVSSPVRLSVIVQVPSPLSTQRVVGLVAGEDRRCPRPRRRRYRRRRRCP